MLMCLSSLGALLAEALQCTYMRLCCQLQRSRGSAGEKNAALSTAAVTTTTTMTSGTLTKRRHGAGNGVSQTVRMIDIVRLLMQQLSGPNAARAKLELLQLYRVDFFMDLNSIGTTVKVLAQLQ